MSLVRLGQDRANAFMKDSETKIVELKLARSIVAAVVLVSLRAALVDLISNPAPAFPLSEVSHHDNEHGRTSGSRNSPLVAHRD
jgi:hypothetical protein